MRPPKASFLKYNFAPNVHELVELQMALNIAAIATAASAGIAAIVAIVQSRMTKNQMDNTLRPWIGMDSNGTTIRNGKLIIVTKNHGTVPALKCQYGTVFN